MKKSDLKDGMVLENRRGDRKILINKRLIGIKYWSELKDFNNDLTSCNNYKELDIVKVYKLNDNAVFIDRLLKDYCLELIWKREEVDWSKVEFGTEVLVRNTDTQEWVEGKFLEFSSDIEHPFKVYIDADSSISWRQCKLKENKPRYNARIFFEKPKNDFPD